MLDIRSSSRRVARFMTRPTRDSTKTAIGTRIRNMSVSCQLMRQAPKTHASARSGSATTLPMSILTPAPSESMSLVKRAVSSLDPWSPNWLTSRWMTLR